MSYPVDTKSTGATGWEGSRSAGQHLLQAGRGGLKQMIAGDDEVMVSEWDSASDPHGG